MTNYKREPSRNTNQFGRGRRSRNRTTRLPSGEVVIKGQVLLNPTLAVGSNIISLTPSALNSGQLGTLSDTFGLYRFENVKLVAYPGQSDTYTVAYYNELSEVPASTNVTNSYIPHSTLITDGTFTTKAVPIPKQMLLGEAPMKFWRTRPSTTTPEGSDPWEQIQGTINFVADAAISVFTMVKYTLRLANAMTTGMTPSPYKRVSIVPKSLLGTPVIDLYLPGTQHPYPVDRDLEDDWARVTALYITSKRGSPTLDQLIKKTQNDKRVKEATMLLTD